MEPWDSAEPRQLVGLFGGWLKTFDKIVVAAIFAILTMLAISYRRRILFLLTGDDTLRVNQFCCCTNSCIQFLCCCHWKINPVRFTAQQFGFWPLQITIRDIKIGNIPIEGDGVVSMVPIISAFAQKTADLYVEIEHNINPVMNTRVVTDDGDIVDFGDTFTLNVHDSALESDVHFKVMDQDIVAHDEIAYLTLDPQTLVRLARDKPGEPLRFQLKTVEGSKKKKRKQKDAKQEPWISFALAISANNDPNHLLATRASLPTWKETMNQDGVLLASIRGVE
jgi:hypothetical protein